MPAVSKKQQMAMGIAHAIQKGEMKGKPGMPATEMAATMKPSDVTDFASTPQAHLPVRARKPLPVNVAPQPPGPPAGRGSMPVKNVGGPPVQKMPMPMAKGGSVKAGGCK